ncbi:hypothetical protein P775_09420 [Puniceibacterium antarcticum]|uniref:Metanogen output domain-containing protein n=1 Tax=Puniceibacterium antarcticum TaxID=1206336 RepID=A0A2G8RG20_9RHOB|nr:methanogen output domain 1-containing protein [Puniceibacterium antarcticum]PIL20433.1 hypothetical protein P775_09420 [Puniceibacterium antarcticum]
MGNSKNIFANASFTRDRDQFLRELIRELCSVLEATVGVREAEGFIALVGGRMGEIMNREYRTEAGQKKLDLCQIADALVDLKRRINGGFSIESIDERQIVLVNTACPFGDYVKDRPSLCMMTSNVFGRIAADNLGYANVELKETIAQGDAGCRVIIRFEECESGRDYFG